MMNRQLYPPGSRSQLDMGESAHLDEDGRPRIIERQFVVADEEAGMRVDRYLKKKIPRLSRNRIQQIVSTGLSRNGETTKNSATVRAGDVLLIRREAQPEPPCPRTFRVLYQDERMLVVDKPAGLPVHASAKFYFNTLARVLSEAYPDQMAQICHRLDRETSGALVVARDRDAARSLKGAFADRRVSKTYRAVVYGRPPADRLIDLPLELVAGEDELNVRMAPSPTGLPSVTKTRVVRTNDTFSLVECVPITGRQHQIRAHLAAIGHPIVGDKLYAHGDDAFRRYCDEGLTAELLERFVLPRQALHAFSITVPHPDDGRQVTVVAELPDELSTLLDSVDRPAPEPLVPDQRER